MNEQAVSIRSVGCRKGYPYYAAGLYARTRHAHKGGYYWKLVRNVTDWHRTVNAVRSAIPAELVPIIVPGVRHGQPCQES